MNHISDERCRPRLRRVRQYQGAWGKADEIAIRLRLLDLVKPDPAVTRANEVDLIVPAKLTAEVDRFVKEVKRLVEVERGGELELALLSRILYELLVRVLLGQRGALGVVADSGRAWRCKAGKIWGAKAGYGRGGQNHGIAKTTVAASRRILPPAWLGFYPALSSLSASRPSGIIDHPGAVIPVAQSGVSYAASEGKGGTPVDGVKEKLIIADPSQGAAIEHDTRLDNAESVEMGTGQGGEAVDRVLALAPPLPPITSGTASPFTYSSPPLAPARANPNSTSLTPTPASASAPAYPFPTSHSAMSRADSYSYSTTEHPNPHSPTFHRPSFFRHRLYARTSAWARERQIRVRVGTYNVNDRLPPAGTEELKGWVGGAEVGARDLGIGAREGEGTRDREKEEAGNEAQAEKQGGDVGVGHDAAECQGSIGRDTPVPLSAGPAGEQGEEVLAFGMQEVGASRLSLPVYFASSHEMLKASCGKRWTTRKHKEGRDGIPSELISQTYEDKPCSFPKGLPVRRTGPRPSLLDSAQGDNCTSEYVR